MSDTSELNCSDRGRGGVATVGAGYGDDWGRRPSADDDGAVRVPSSDHVSVAVHELGGTGPPLLISHATGFHGYCYLPVADELMSSFTVYAVDYRGHGDTARPDDWAVDWTRYGDDAEAVATAIAPDGGLVAFGHSMGGAALLMAARRRPGLFDVAMLRGDLAGPDAQIDGADADGMLAAPGGRIAGGTSQVQRNIIGERLLGLPR